MSGAPIKWMGAAVRPAPGRCEGFLHDLPYASQVAADAVGRSSGTELEILFSRGIPGTVAWRR